MVDIELLKRQVDKVQLVMNETGTPEGARKGWEGRLRSRKGLGGGNVPELKKIARRPWSTRKEGWLKFRDMATKLGFTKKVVGDDAYTKQKDKTDQQSFKLVGMRNKKIQISVGTRKNPFRRKAEI